MHDKNIVYKVETVWSGVEGLLDHLGPDVWVQGRELVDVLTSVAAVWHAETEVKVEGFQQSGTE